MENVYDYVRIMYRNYLYYKNGYGDLVVMNIEAYEQIVETQLIDNAISEAEEEYEKTGVLLDAKDTLASLRKRRIGF